MIPLYSVHIPQGTAGTVEAVLKSGRIAGGEHVHGFEQKLQELIGNPLVIAAGEMSASIAMCLYQAGVRPGDDVVACPMSCLATTVPVLNLFANIQWCDCDPRTGGMDPVSLASAITPRTRAVIAFHWAGNPLDLDPIYEVAGARGIPVIEDASEALGAEYKGKRLGSTGADFVVFSFYPNKHLTTIDGAAVSFRSREQWEKARWLRRYGIHTPTFRCDDGELNPESDIREAGWNNSMNQVSASVGLAQFEDLGSRLLACRRNGEFYDRSLSGVSGLTLLDRPPDSRSAYWVYTFLVRDRDRLMSELKSSGIQASKVHLRNDIYGCFGTGAADLPGVREFSARTLSIPCGWWVTPEDAERIVQTIMAKI